MSGPEMPGVSVASCAADLTEIAALRARAGELAARAARRGLALPPLGRVELAPHVVVLGLRPERWLLIGPPAPPGASAALWLDALSPAGIALDCSSGCAPLYLTGVAVREMLSRGCRLDLDARHFPVGSCAATLIAQVPVSMAALPAGWLLLAPASLAHHLREWLTAAARPFGYAGAEDVTVAALSGDAAS